MEAAAASTEIMILGWSVVLLFAQIILQATSTYNLGGDYLAGPRDEPRAVKPIAGRFARALRNFMETYPAFIALALALAVTGKTGEWGAVGAWLWLIARVVYVAVYAAGIPWVRTLVWLVSIAGLAMMFLRLMS